MINKYQQGGSVIQQLQLLPKELQEQIMQAFALWAQEKGIDIQQIQLDTNSLEQALVQFIQETQQQLVQAARHGAKLKYIKSLKNMCEEDEELYYYKKGGSLGCGCRKKENGGEIEKVQEGTVARFKKNIKQKKNNQNNNYIQPNVKHSKIAENPKSENKGNKLDPRTTKTLPNGKYPKYWTSLERQIWEREFGEEANGPSIKKNSGGSKMKLIKRGGEVCPKCGKVHAAGMGCAVAKFKMHQQGGSLNGIPFYLKGTLNLGIRSKEEIDAINLREKEIAKLYFKSSPTISNIWNGLKHAYNGWINPQTIYQTGTAPVPGFSRNLIGLGKVYKTINGINYYKNSAGELKTAQEMAKEIKAAKDALRLSVGRTSPNINLSPSTLKVPNRTPDKYTESVRSTLSFIEDGFKNGSLKWEDLNWKDQGLWNKFGNPNIRIPRYSSEELKELLP